MINHDLKINALSFSHKELRNILENHDIFEKEYVKIIAKLMVKKIRKIKRYSRVHEMMTSAGLPVGFVDYGNI